MSVSRETSARLNVFADMVLHWTTRINLISTNDRSYVWPRHIEDSLQLVDLLPAGMQRAIDLGSGAGFPGLVLAIATGVHFDLIEADQRKAAFLREAIRATGAPATVHARRIEAYRCEPVQAVTVRALAPLPILLPLVSKFLTPDGHALLMKGENADNELTAASEQWHMRVRRVPSRSSARATILDITGLHRVGSNA